MNLEQLEAVRAIAEKGSFRAAAEALGRSQPALSASIKNLEDEFGLQIFDRDTYRPRLTEAGAAFLEAARKTLESAQYVRRVAVEWGKNKAETKIRVAADSLIPLRFVERMAALCGESFPPVHLVLRKSLFKTSAKDLMNGDVELALAPCPRDDQDLERIVLTKASLVGACSKKTLGKKAPTPELIAKWPQIIFYDKSEDETPDESLPRPRVQSASRIFVPDHFTKRQLIEAGVGWGRVSADEAKKQKDLVVLPREVCPEVTLDLCLLRSRRRPAGPLARKIWQTFSEEYQ